MAALGIVVSLLDTSVLFPQHLRNTLMCAAEQELYQPIWSGRILGELAEVLRGRRHISDARIQHLLSQMRRAFPVAEVEGYESLIASMPVHASDQHLLAAAVHGQANVLVTSNLRHFTPAVLAGYGIEPQSPDDFLIRRLNDAPHLMMAAIAQQLASYKRPSLTYTALCERLAPVTPRFAARLRNAEHGV
ncbi:MAG: PIN domain-containing protein [Chloroflexota bacterium]